MNQGRGIKIYKTLKEIQTFIYNQMPNTPLVVQKYLEKPLLFKDRKFDIRLWVLATGKYNIYVYKQSYVRTSSSKYELENTQDYLAHLTNNCFQVLSDQYGAHEEGNIVSLEDLETHIRETKCPNYTISDHFLPLASSIAVDVVLAGAGKMKTAESSFELFGLDLIIDEDLRVWLIECNVNPHLGTPNSFMKRNVPNMINELLSLTVDQVYPPIVTPEGYDTNLWQLVYNGPAKRREHVLPDSLYPIKQFSPLPEERKIDELPSSPKALITKIPQSPQATNSLFLKAKVPPIGSDANNKQKPKGCDIEDELDALESEVQSKKITEDESKVIIDFTVGESLVQPTSKVRTIYSLDIIQEALLKQFKDYISNLNELSKQIERLFEVLAAPKVYSEQQIMRSLRTIKSVLDTQFDYMAITSKYIGALLGVLRAPVSISLALEVLDTLILMLKCKTNTSQFVNSIVEIFEFLARGLFQALQNPELKCLESRMVVYFLQAVYYLGTGPDKMYYLPGKTTEIDLIRKVMVFTGVPSILASIQQISDSTNKTPALANRLLYSCFSSEDLQLQKEILALRQEEGPNFKAQCLSFDKVSGFASCRSGEPFTRMTLQKANKMFLQELKNIFGAIDLQAGTTTLNKDNGQHRGRSPKGATTQSGPLHRSPLVREGSNQLDKSGTSLAYQKLTNTEVVEASVVSNYGRSTITQETSLFSLAFQRILDTGDKASIGQKLSSVEEMLDRDKKRIQAQKDTLKKLV